MTNPAVNPERIIKEAIRLINTLPDDLDFYTHEDVMFNITELNDLIKRLYKAGITLIHEDGRHNGFKEKIVVDFLI